MTNLKQEFEARIAQLNESNNPANEHFRILYDYLIKLNETIDEKVQDAVKKLQKTATQNTKNNGKKK